MISSMQTGDAYRERLGLGPEDLAVLVGGSAVRELHQQQQEMARGSSGSESAEGLLPDETYVHFEGSLEDGPLRRWLQQQPQALLQAPIVVCTIDHLVPATEGICGGRQILPMCLIATTQIFNVTFCRYESLVASAHAINQSIICGLPFK